MRRKDPHPAGEGPPLHTRELAENAGTDVDASAASRDGRQFAGLLRRIAGGPIARSRTAPGPPPYFLPADYRENPARTFVPDGEYWNDDRIAASYHFQYYAYAQAAALFRRQGYESVIDVGCGAATKLAAFFGEIADTIHMVDQPGSERVASNILPGAAFTGADLETPPPMDTRFDLVLCMDVLEHLADPDPLARWLHERVSDRGRLVLSTPDRDVRRGVGCRTSPNPLHVREWSSPELRAYLADRGFEVVDQRNLPLERPPAWIYRLGQWLNPVLPAPRWGACQLIVAHPTR